MNKFTKPIMNGGNDSNDSLPWTGERFVPEMHGNIAIEHLHRYAMARELAVGKTVLDIACGEGYGSRILAEVARHVIGVDISSDVIDHAVRRYKRNNIEFKIGSCAEIPLADGSVDLVVSFETIEHHGQPEAMLAEIKRVLRPDGVFIISSPEKNEYSIVPNYSNPFHVKELYRHEFERLMALNFKHIAMFGQRVVYGSGIFRESFPETIITYDAGTDFQHPVPGMGKPIYLIAVASDVTLPPTVSSFFDQPISESEVTRNWSSVVAERDGQIASLNQNIAERDGQIATILSSTSWRLTRSLRLLGDQLKRMRRWFRFSLSTVLFAPKRFDAEWYLKQNPDVAMSGMDPYRHYILFGKAEGRQPAPEAPMLRSNKSSVYHLLRIAPQIIARKGGFRHTCKVALRVYRREGLTGVKHRIKQLQISNLNQTVAERDGQVDIALDYVGKVTESFDTSRSPLQQETERKRSGFKKIHLDDWTGEKIIFPNPPKDPSVSIIIPVYNNASYTFNSLKSILKNTKDSFEIVVVDDASEDETPGLLKNVENIQVVKNKTNQGFVKSCNMGAKASKGKYLFFLNNDTIVAENWLEPLIETIEKDKVGAVGVKLVYPDGKMQEAGGIIWKDTSGCNYGRYDDPDKPEYNFVREVDYCSGAALLVRRDLFKKFGGFDERFKPGYYEDTDLCFSIRSSGYKIIYQPRSVVIHFEGITGGTDITSGVKKYQEINKEKFLEKWFDVLEKEHYEADSTNLFLARNRRKGKHILVIDHYVPTFDKDSGSYRMYNLLKILAELEHKITFIGDNPTLLEPYTSILQQLGIEVIYAPYIKSINEYLAEHGKYFDIVILSRAPIAANHISKVKKHCDKAKIIFDTVDLHFLRELRRAEVENNKKVLEEAEKLKKLEIQLAKMSDVTFVVSQVEKEIMLKEDTSLRIEVISNIHEIKQPEKDFSERKDIMFVGGFPHLPNIDAVKWFIKEVFPLIKEKISDIKFYVIGNEPPKEIKCLSSDDVIVTGYVENLTPYFEKCKVSVSPLRYGAGVKGKINHSMSHGLPVVTTSIGAEGVGLIDGVDALIADDPEEFAEKVILLYENEKLWNKLSRNSIENVQRNYSPEVIKERLENVFNQGV